MPLDKNEAEKIIDQLRSMDVDRKLKAINEAQDMYVKMFAGEMGAGEYAYSAMVAETLYNLIRDELRNGFKKIVPKELDDSIGAEKKKVAPKATKKTNQKMSSEAVLAGIAELFGKPKEEKSDVSDAIKDLFTQKPPDGELKT